MYFRVFSRNINKRYAENQKFLNARYEWTVKAERRKKRFAQRKQYKFFKCPMCKQEVRVPRGHGKICITCPKRILSNRHIDLSDFSSAALSSIVVATATPHSSALQMKIHSASYSQKLIFRCTGTSIYIPVHKSMEKRNVWIYNCQ